MPNQPITIRRWELAASFVALTLVFVFVIVHVQNDSASIHDLQRTNCSLRQFLLTAREARVRSAGAEYGEARKRDLAAARGYADLADRFQGKAIGHCPSVTVTP